MNAAPTRPFTPSRESAAELSARTVGRADLLGILHSRLLKAATSRARPHTLLLGPRGSGKTHLLEVVLYRARQDPSFSQRVVVVRVEEDAVGITRYSDLLARVLIALGTSPRAMPPPDAREGRIGELLSGRVVLLVIENLDRVFADIGLAGQRAFRAWVETSGSVMLLATTPSLFPGLAVRDQPWFGGLSAFPLRDLSASEGRTLLAYIAGQRGDARLAEFVNSPTGAVRVAAIAELTGGSPRIWMILAELVTTESLDELAPAVEGLLEDLVPYYQQLLWGLSANERRLVLALAGSTGASTVSELAAASEIEQRTAAATLGRLAEARWVIAEKPGITGDRRTTYYRLREPMLRHHLQYRGLPDEPLELLVTLLRVFYDPHERAARYLTSAPGSLTEMTLAATIDSLSAGDALWARSAFVLQLQAREWAEHDPEPDYRRAGLALDGVLALASGDDARFRHGSAELRAIAPDLDTELAGLADRRQDDDPAVRVGLLLGALADAAQSDRLGALLRLVALCWDAPLRPTAAGSALEGLLTASELDRSDRVLLSVAANLGIAYRNSGDLGRAIPQFEATLTDRERILGPDHPDTLTSRNNLAGAYREAGDLERAIALFQATLTDRERILGPDHPDTLTYRNNLAGAHYAAGDLERAI
ncbi:MAG: tetratricopeptide repeat protein, partial [Candidatus Nanopelagicales bacterium]